MFYVYRHIRLDKKTPFYVGKGTGYRAFRKGPKDHNQYWKNIVTKYGHRVEIIKDFDSEKDAFSFELLLTKLYKSYGFCEANITDGGGGMVGYKRSAEQIKRMSIVHKGKIVSSATKEKLRLANIGKVEGSKNPHFGKHHTAEAKKKIGDANRGKPSKLKNTTLSEETKAKISLSHKGKKLSEETKIKLSLANKGRVKSVEERRKISLSNKGKIVSEETGRKISKAKLGIFYENSPFRKRFRGKCYTPFGIFESLKEAAKQLKTPYRTIKDRCDSKKIIFKDWHLEKEAKCVKL